MQRVRELPKHQNGGIKARVRGQALLRGWAPLTRGDQAVEQPLDALLAQNEWLSHCILDTLGDQRGTDACQDHGPVSGKLRR